MRRIGAATPSCRARRDQEARDSQILAEQAHVGLQRAAAWESRAMRLIRWAAEVNREAGAPADQAERLRALRRMQTLLLAANWRLQEALLECRFAQEHLDAEEKLAEIAAEAGRRAGMGRA